MIVMDIGITESLPKDALRASSVTSTSTATWRTRSWWVSLALCLACNAFGWRSRYRLIESIRI